MRAKQERENKTFKLDRIEEEEGRHYGRPASSGQSKKTSEEKKSRVKLWLKFSINLGLSWWSSGEDSVLPLQGAQVRSLVRELRSCIPCSEAKNKQL